MQRGASRHGRARARAARAARLRRRPTTRPAGSRARSTASTIVAAYPFTRPRVGAPGTISLAALPRQGRRAQLLAVLLPALHARGAGRLGRRQALGRQAASSSSASTSRICPGPATAFMRRFHITYPVIADDGPLIGHYGVTGYPETFFIDKHGRVIPLPPNRRPGRAHHRRRDARRSSPPGSGRRSHR